MRPTYTSKGEQPITDLEDLEMPSKSLNIHLHHLEVVSIVEESLNFISEFN